MLFLFFIVRMPDISDNITCHILYGSIMSEILRIASSTLHYGGFIPRTADLFERMINQGAAASNLFKQFDKVVKPHPDAFTSFNQNVNTIKSDIEQHTRSVLLGSHDQKAILTLNRRNSGHGGQLMIQTSFSILCSSILHTQKKIMSTQARLGSLASVCFLSRGGSSNKNTKGWLDS